jgi:hypothetical protein
MELPERHSFFLKMNAKGQPHRQNRGACIACIHSLKIRAFF